MMWSFLMPRLRATLGTVLALGLLAALVSAVPHAPRPSRGALEPERGERYPSDWFYAQRAFPSGTIPQQQWLAALDQARAERSTALQRARVEGGPTWTAAGPYNIGGRVTAIVAAPGGNPVYLGAANGGVFKSTDFGAHWSVVFDGEGVTSIGALAMDPANSNTIYVGTGEANSSVDSYDGTGLYRSTDAGATWSYVGLSSTHRIARVAVDPSNSQRLFVAAMGSQFSTGPNRGLYRSVDGGTTWSQVLFVSDSTGCTDVVLNPARPETMYCATWERVRRPTYRRAYGPECGIWRSLDGGTTWFKLSAGLPPADDNLGRIGLAVARSSPSTVYAQITSGAALGYAGVGMYRSQNDGASWIRRDTGTTFTSNFGGFCWYFGDVVVNPNNADQVFSLGVNLIFSTDGGATFTDALASAHVDEHALWFDPTNTLRIYLGNDGGFWSSTIGGPPWTQSLDTPITQFYACSVDPSNSSRLLGGAQDNSTSITSGSPSGWSIILGGDGFQSMVSPLAPNVLYAEWQYCCDNSGLRRSGNGGSSWTTPTGFAAGDRYNWDTPICMNPRNPLVILVGSQRVYKSTNGGFAYTPVSADLSTNPVSSLVYGTISTLAISPADTSVYYAGTDDGRVWRSPNAGVSWNNVSAGLPVRYVTSVAPDPVDPGVVYVTLSGFTQDDFVPRVYRSATGGASWAAIAANLPDAPVNDLIVDPSDPNTLYLATDVGVYASRNAGGGWFPLGVGMPIDPVNDLALYASGGSRILIAATHGRSQWKLDVSALPAAAPEPRPASIAFALGPPVPNPSRGAVRLSLELPTATTVEAAIYDVSGRRVSALDSGPSAAGRRMLTWDGRDASGSPAPAGVYFARVRTDLGVRSRAIVRAN
jgi:photosystem II stability/assembly factor-like uncharacterized protein